MGHVYFFNINNYYIYNINNCKFKKIYKKIRKFSFHTNFMIKTKVFIQKLKKIRVLIRIFSTTFQFLFTRSLPVNPREKE